jgi:chloramphenicol 3-O phosphotransferase
MAAVRRHPILIARPQPARKIENAGGARRDNATCSAALVEHNGMTSDRTGPPDVLFVNGASSAGKTSLIRAVQDQITVPYLHVGLDHFFASVPEPWGGGGPGRYSTAGFAYAACARSGDGLPRTAITVGSTGAALFAAYRRCLVTLLQQGCLLAIEELLLSDEIGADYLALLAPYDVQYVLMTAGPECLEQRCAARGYRPGFGRWSLTAASRLPCAYDLTFDSEQMTTQECAAAVAASWQPSRRAPAAPD